MQHVIIAGFGPTGRVLADALLEDRVPFAVIELNVRTVRRQKSLGRSIVLGDATNQEVLESAGIRSAAAVVITFPDPIAVLRTCQLARALAPGALIAIRTRHLSDGLRARQLGADIAVVEEVETARAMATAVTAALKSRDQAPRKCADDSARRESRVHSTRSRPARYNSSQTNIAIRRSMVPERQGKCSTCETDGTRPSSSSLQRIMRDCAN